MQSNKFLSERKKSISPQIFEHIFRYDTIKFVIRLFFLVTVYPLLYLEFFPATIQRVLQKKKQAHITFTDRLGSNLINEDSCYRVLNIQTYTS